MKFLFDISFIVPELMHMSIPIHALRILDNLPENMHGEVELLVHPACRSIIKERLPHLKCHNFKETLISRAVKALKPVIYRRAVKKSSAGCDWILNTDEFRPYITTKHAGLKKAFLVHDLKGIKMGGNIAKRRKFYVDMLKSADLILCISEFTRQDVLKHFPWVDPARTAVLYNSIDMPSPQIDSHIKNLLPAKYILWISTLSKYKNILTTLQAFALIADRTDHDLVVVGRETAYWTEVCKPFLEEHNLSDRVIRLQDLTSPAIPYLYKHSSLFVTSSSHEGFGFPPIEAAIMGTPVVCSMAEALPETTQMLLNYYEPETDARAMANKMLETLAAKVNPARQASIAHTLNEAYSPAKQVATLRQLLASH